MADKIQLPVLITSLSTKVDGSIKIAMETRELQGHEAAKMFELRGREAWVLIAPQAFEDDVSLPKERADPAVGTKTPSQRLRAVIFRLWEQQGSKSGVDFESYYRLKLESIIDQFKERLE